MKSLEILRSRGYLKEATELTESLVSRQNYSSLSTLIFLGSLYEQAKDRSSAMDVYKTILDKSPEHYEAKSKLYALVKTMNKFTKKFEVY